VAWTTDKTSLATPVSNNVFGTTTLAYTTTNAVASNAWIFIGIMSYFSDSVSSVADDGPGLSWTVTKYTPTSDANFKIAIARAFAPAGLASGRTITATWTGGDTTSKEMAGSSFLGGDSSSFDVGGGGASGNSVNWASANLTTAEANELIIGFGRFANADATPATPVAPAVTLFYDQASLGDGFYMAYKIAASAGSNNIAATFLAADNWGAMAIALKVAAGGTTVTNEAALRTAHTPVTWRT